MSKLRNLSLGLFLLCWAGLASASLPTGISTSIKAVQSEFSADDEIAIEITYTNTTAEEIKVLTWGTALEGRINHDFLEITFDGQELGYIGRHYKRAPATSADYINFAPFSSVSARVELADSYPIQSKGEYRVSYRTSELSVNDAQSNKTTVESISFKLKQDITLTLFKQPSSFVGCTNSEASLLNQATTAAESLASVASSSLRSTPVAERPNARRYNEWFGAYSQGRWDRVQRNFDNIFNTIRFQRIQYDCSCNNSAFAFVYPSRPYEVFLCNAFWSAPLTGTDSKAGTVIHELSHFTVVSDTDDHVYGQSGARNLARTNPSRAISNADSHEYFAENTPFLTMPPPLPPAPKPDLLISSRTLSDATVMIGRSLSVSGVVSNQGEGDAPATSLRLTLRAGAFSSNALTNLPAIAAGENTAYSINFSAPLTNGIYSAEVCITAVANESNTSNNCASLPSLLVEDKQVIMAPIIDLILSN